MTRFKVQCFLTLAACLLISPAFANGAPGVRVQASVALHSVDSRPSDGRVCFDSLFYGPFPGKVNYCLGMRDWNAGNYQAGLELLTLAAGWGNKNAQYTLGLIHFNGNHVPADRALGLAWLRLADERHNDPQITRVMRSVSRLATPAQRTQATQLNRQMLANYGDKVAATRAWHHWQHWQRSHDRRNEGCVFMHGRAAAAALRAGMAVTRLIKIGKRPSVVVCMALQIRHHLERAAASDYFSGWAGTVTLGPLQAVPAPAASSGH